MLGIVLAVLAALVSGFKSIIHRSVLIKEDSLSYAFLWQLIAAVIFLPLFFIEFKLTTTPIAWLLVAASSTLWAAAAYSAFKSYTQLEVSIRSPISQSKLLFTLLLAVIFLRESLTAEKVIGTLLIFGGIWLVAKHKSTNVKIPASAVMLTLFGALMMSTALIIDKYATAFFTPGMYSFMVYFFPAVLLAPFALARKNQLHSLVKNKLRATASSAALDGIQYYLILHAFRVIDASVVVPIKETSTIVAVIGGILLLGEKPTIEKIASAIIVVLGAILVSGIYKIF